jgi:hypothetical protein
MRGFVGLGAGQLGAVPLSVPGGGTMIDRESHILDFMLDPSFVLAMSALGNLLKGNGQ